MPTVSPASPVSPVPTELSARIGDESARGRLLNGMADAIVEKGFPTVTVADVVRLARVSRRTFYEHFTSRDDCYLGLLNEANDELIAYIAGSVDRSKHPEEQVRQAVEAWLAGSAQRPDLTRSWIRDSPSLPSAQLIHAEGRRRFVALVRALVDDPAYRSDYPPVSTEMIVILVGGLRELIASQVEAGRPLADLTEVAVAASIALLNAT